MRPSLLVAVLIAGPAAATGQLVPDTVLESDSGVRYRLEVVLSGLVVPSALDFLPDGRLLLAERPAGHLSLVSPDTGEREPVEGVPAVFGDLGADLGAGLLDVRAHPDFDSNRWIYLSWTEGDSVSSALVVSRARLQEPARGRGARLVDLEHLFRAAPALDTADHYGGRLHFQDGHLFVTSGDHHDRRWAQDLSSHLGKVLRLREDGTVPPDNPFARRPGALAEIWSLGHRNPQGIARHPTTGEIWMTEHGPLGGDELNVLRRGANYGWPLATWGREYAGPPVGDGSTHGEGIEQPVYVLERSSAPSGLIFYAGDAFPRWRESLLAGSMGRRHLKRLVLEEGRVLHEERLMNGLGFRVREVAQGPDGLIYVTVDEGMLIRVRPAG